MKKIIFLFMIITIIISCKDEKNNQTKTNQEEKSIIEENKKNLQKIETVFDYIDFSEKKRSRYLQDTLGDILPLNKISLFREESSKDVYIIIELEELTNAANFENYTIVARMFPYSLEDLRPESIKRNLEFDSWYFPIKTRDVNSKSYIYAKVADDNDGFKKVILQLINKSTNEISPKKIIIENFEAYK